MAGGWMLLGGDFLTPQPPPLPPVPPPEQPPPPPEPEAVPEPVLEQWRQYQESDWHWGLRRQFILRHLASYPGAAIDQLLSLSVLWTNHVFMGCRYGSQVMEKVLKMAEGIDIGEMPSFELVPRAKPPKRPCSPPYSPYASQSILLCCL